MLSPGHSHWTRFRRAFSRCVVWVICMHSLVCQVLGVIMHNQTGLQHSMTAVSLAWQSHCVLNRKKQQRSVSCVILDHLTPQQFGLTVDEFWFPCRAVALTSVMKNLDKGALLSCRTSNPLVKSIFEHQVELWTILEDNTSKGWGMREWSQGKDINSNCKID